MKIIATLPLRNLAILFLFACTVPVCAKTSAQAEEKIYVAEEGANRIAVFDSASKQLLTHIELATEQHGGKILLSPHNVQVASDGKTVWVTANSSHEGGQHQSSAAKHEENASAHEGMEHMQNAAPKDEVVVINPVDDSIIKHISLASGAHLAHVAVASDGSAAYVTAQNENAIYIINAHDYSIAQKISAPPDSQPHGLRIAPDASHAYIALLAGKGLGILDLKTKQLKIMPLNGAAVQTAVTPDGKWVLVSLYDNKQLAVYDPDTQSVRYIELPKTSRGPVQLYPAPDGRFVYAADQGHYFNQPDGNQVFKIDLQQFKVTQSIQAGSAPHGIVIAKDGKFAYVTNLVSDDLSVLDLINGKETARLPTGKQPNGVSIWNKNSGGTP